MLIDKIRELKKQPILRMISFWGQSLMKFGHRDHKFNFECVEFEMPLRKLSVGCQISWMGQRREKYSKSFIYIVTYIHTHIMCVSLYWDMYMSDYLKI